MARRFALGNSTPFEEALSADSSRRREACAALRPGGAGNLYESELMKDIRAASTFENCWYAARAALSRERIAEGPFHLDFAANPQ